MYLVATGSKGVTAPYVMPCTLRSLQSLKVVAQHSQTPSWGSSPIDVSFHNYPLWSYPTVSAAMSV